MGRKRLENKVRTKILKFRPSRDNEGRYISYCDFGYHQGLIKTPEICIERNCNHYKKLYIK